MISPELYDRVRDRIAQQGFTPRLQTKIALVLGAAANGNLAFHAAMQWLPKLGVAQPFIISQAARELETLTLLNRTTQWSTECNLLVEAGGIVAPLTMAWTQIMLPPGPLFSPSAAYRGISLGHAQLARIRLAPILPEDCDLLDPFVITLMRIEQENGRMLQTQIRLLKSIGNELPLTEREQQVEQDQQLVDGVVSNFLNWLAA